MSTFEERARLRASWPVKRMTLEDEAPAGGPDDPTAAWNAVIELTREAYALMDALPSDLARDQWPSRLFQPGEPRPDSNGL